MTKQKLQICLLTLVGIVAVSLATWYVLHSSIDLRKEGLKHLRDGDAEKGASFLEQHLELEPRDLPARRQLAEHYAREDKQDLAKKHLLLLTEQKDSTEADLRTLSALALRIGDNELAEESLRKLLSNQPQDFSANLALAELYFNTGRAREAVPLAEAAVRIEPDSVESYLLLADSLSEAGRNQEMIQPLEICVRLSPDHLTAHANLAFAFQSAGRSKEAIHEAEWCLQRAPQLLRVRVILAQAQRDTGLFDDAQKNIEAVLAAEPGNLDAALIQADLLSFRGHGERVYDLLLPLYQSHSTDRRLISHLMRAAIAKGDREQANHWKKTLSSLIPK